MKKILFVICLLLLPSITNATNITFKQGDGKGDPSTTYDTYFNPSNGNPTLGWITVGTIGSNTYRGVVGFPNFIGSGTNQMPEGVKIIDAKLRLRLNNAGNNIVSGMNIYRILQEWDYSSTSSYYSTPGYIFRKSGIQWTNAGIGSSTSRTSTISDSQEVANTTGVYYDFDITSDIQSMAVSLMPNYGYLIKSDTEAAGEYKLFNSSEASLSQRPILDITYQTIDTGDTTPPVLGSPDPSGELDVHTIAATISIHTDEDAYCKYSASESISFNDMSNSFLSTWSTTHSVNVSGLTNGSTYHYYVRCTDANTNKNTSDYDLVFSVAADPTAPNAVSDLTIDSCGTNSCDLSWTAVGNDGSSFQAESIDIRYATFAITEGTWGSAARFDGESDALYSGLTEQYTISELAPNTTYYFGVKTTDFSGNESDISNIPSDTTDAVSLSTTINFWNAGIDVKVRPIIEIGTNKTAEYSLAKNEWGGINLGLTTTQRELDNVNVSVDITGISNTIVYYVGNMHIITITADDGDTGEYPDIMYPKVDSYYGETRNTFPLNLSNISRAYPFITGYGKNNYGVNLGDLNGLEECGHIEGCWQTNVDPASGFVYPYDGTQQGAGLDAGVYNRGNGSVTVDGAYYGEEDFKRYYIIIENNGSAGVSTFKWSDDGGETFVTGVKTSTTPILLSSGITVAFSGSTLKSNDEWIINVSKNYTHNFWIDFKTPSDITPGDYSGTITVTADGMDNFEMPVSIHVWNFTLPDTARLKSHFENFAASVYGGGFSQGHPDVAASDMIENVYVAAGLNHKISMSTIIYTNSGSQPSCTCSSYNESTREITMNCNNFNTYHGQFLNGGTTTTQPAGIPIAGDLTTLVKRGYTSYPSWINMNDGSCVYTNATNFRKDKWKGFYEYLVAQGKEDKFFVWSKDEPAYSEGWNEVAGVYTEWKNINSNIDLFVTNDVCEAITFGKEDYTDIFVPQPSWGDRPNGQEWIGVTNPRCAKPEYDAWRNEVAGRDVWSYHACNEKGGCGLHGAFFYRGWPNYAVDKPTISTARMRMWYDRHRNYNGELYYATNQGHYRYAQRNVNPFDTTFWYGSNGDGMLFYPGWASTIGGTKDIPIESLRLKGIRLGMQDYDYFAMTDDLGESAYVDNLLSNYVISATDISPTAEEIESVRESLANKIQETFEIQYNRGYMAGGSITGGTIK